MVLFGVSFWVLLDPLTLKEAIEGFSPPQVLAVLMQISLFFLMFYVAYFFKGPMMFVNVMSKLDYGCKFKRKLLFRLAFLSFLVGVTPIFIAGFGGNWGVVRYQLTHAGRWQIWQRGRWGGWKDWMLTGMGFFKVAAVQFAVFNNLFVRFSLILTLCALVCVWEAFLCGTRHFFGIITLPAFVSYYIWSFHRKRVARYWVFGGLFLLMAAMQMQFIVRQQSSDTTVKEVVQQNVEETVKSSPLDYHRDDQFYRMLLYTKLIPAVVPHSGEWLLLRPFYHFVPRAVWKGKPEGISRFFEKYHNVEGVGMTTYASSIIGEFYMCNGWWGIVVSGLFMGWISVQCDSLIPMTERSPAVLLLYSYALIIIFVTIRSFNIVYNWWYVFVPLYWVMKKIELKDGDDNRKQGGRLEKRNHVPI